MNAEKFWNRMAPRYARSPVRDEESYQTKLTVTQSYLRPDWEVLEFGCGTGSTAIRHAPYVKQIKATDISGKMLEIAESKARSAGVGNIRFQQGTLDTLQLKPESYDAVLGLNILHLLENVEAAIAQVHGLLRPGGIFVSSTPLMADIRLHWRILIRLLQFVGFIPSAKPFDKALLISMLTNAGFSIDHEWQPAASSVFIVARKAPEKTA